MENFSDYDINVKSRRSGRVKTVCPRCRTQRSHPCSQPSLSVDIDRGLWKCHYCGWSGHLRDGSAAWAPSAAKRSFRRPEPRDIRTPDQKALAWFLGRGIGKGTLEKAAVDSGTEFFPARNAKLDAIRFNYLLDGQLINVKSRSYDKDFALVSGAELIPWNIDAVADTPECVITEGEIDALSVMEAGRADVISVPNGASGRADYLNDFMESHFAAKRMIYIAVDTDSAGCRLRDELLERFGADRCAVVDWGEGCKDANELLVKRGRRAVAQALHEARLRPVEGLNDISSYVESLDDIYRNGFPPGLASGWDNFDRYCRMERGRLCVVTGIPSSGKSEWVDELVIRYCLRHAMKAAYFSPENYPTSYHALKIIEKLGGCTCNPHTMPLTIYDAAKEWIAGHIYHLNPPGHPDIDTLLRLAGRAVDRHGVNIVVLDPFNRIETEPGSDIETLKISRMLDKITDFAHRRDCLVILVAHPRKMGPADGDAGVPDMYSIAGSGTFYSKADFGITVHRDVMAGNVLVRVHKVKYRQLGERGDVRFSYNVRNGRYTPIAPGAAGVPDTAPWVSPEPGPDIFGEAPTREGMPF